MASPSQILAIVQQWLCIHCHILLFILCLFCRALSFLCWYWRALGSWGCCLSANVMILRITWMKSLTEVDSLVLCLLNLLTIEVYYKACLMQLFVHAMMCIYFHLFATISAFNWPWEVVSCKPACKLWCCCWHRHVPQTCSIPFKK